uniref:Bm1328, isoform a n=1 Tax=Brugia malayi TaxID=6279 RepID=A0A1I9G2B3_BRUMA|nr:Bm1328, isoform a [Brugia malayi]
MEMNFDSDGDGDGDNGGDCSQKPVRVETVKRGDRIDLKKRALGNLLRKLSHR